jgi:hypothetical protein
MFVLLTRTIFLPGVLLTSICIWSCSTNKKEVSVTNEINRDTVSSVMTKPEDEDDAEINDDDYGAPGIADTKLLFAELEPAEQEFLLNLQQKKIEEIINSTGFLMLVPGVGIQPVSSFGISGKDLIAVKDVDRLLNDSSFINSSISLYSWHYDNCNAQNLPDGIYLNDTFITPIEENLVSENQLAQLKQLNKRITGLQYPYSKDFNVRLTTKSGGTFYLTLRTFLLNQKLYLFMIDQRDCGA